MITKGSWYVTSGLPHQTQPTYFPVPFSLSFPPLYVHGRTGDYGVFWQFNHYWPKPKRSKVLSEIYPKFAKSLIQIAAPKNIQYNVNRFSRPNLKTAARIWDCIDWHFTGNWCKTPPGLKWLDSKQLESWDCANCAFIALPASVATLANHSTTCLALHTMCSQVKKS